MAAIDGKMCETSDDQPAGTGDGTPPAPGHAGRRWLRFLPLAVAAAGLGVGYAAGLQHYLSFGVLVEKRGDLLGFVARHGPASALVFVLSYALAVAFSFPAASVLTVIGGFLFGWLAGGAMTAVAATAGATAIFLAARTAFGEVLRRRAGSRFDRLAAGFEDNAFSYLLALRLAPIFPFFVVNIAPAFFRVSLRDYVVATFAGILPGTFAYAWLGQGLDSVIVAASRAGRDVSLSDLVTWQITLAFAILAAVAAVPPLIRRKLRR